MWDVVHDYILSQRDKNKVSSQTGVNFEHLFS